MTYLTVIASLLGALGVGSVVGQYVLGGQQRRETRSQVLRRFADVENARWHNDLPALADAIRQLQIAALVARVPRLAIDRYTLLARRAQSELTYVGEEDFEFVLLPEVPVGDEVAAAARDLSDLIWAPWWTRLRLLSGSISVKDATTS